MDSTRFNSSLSVVCEGFIRTSVHRDDNCYEADVLRSCTSLRKMDDGDTRPEDQPNGRSICLIVRGVLRYCILRIGSMSYRFGCHFDCFAQVRKIYLERASLIPNTAA